MLEHALHAPETATGDDDGLDAVRCRHVDRGGRDDHGVFGGERGRDDKSGDRQRADRGGTKRKTAELAAGHWVFLWDFLWVIEGGRFDGSLGRKAGFAIAVGLPDAPRYGAARTLLQRRTHEFVNKARNTRGL